MDNAIPDPIAEAIARQVAEASNTATRTTLDKAVEAITLTLQNEVSDEGMERTTAHRIFAYFTDRLGVTDDNPFSTKYCVDVNYNYNTLFSVTVEADDEDEALSEVKNNLSLSSLKVSGNLSYSGEAEDTDADFEDYEGNDNIIDVDDLDLQFEVNPVD